jgi:hypothetical protein
MTTIQTTPSFEQTPAPQPSIANEQAARTTRRPLIVMFWLVTLALFAAS